MLPCVCSVIDHRGRQNVVRTSVTHSAAPRVPLFCSYHILTSSVIYYLTDARQHGIYLLNINHKHRHQNFCQWKNKIRRKEDNQRHDGRGREKWVENFCCMPSMRINIFLEGILNGFVHRFVFILICTTIVWNKHKTKSQLKLKLVLFMQQNVSPVKPQLDNIRFEDINL